MVQSFLRGRDFGTAYPNAEPRTHCEAKKLREWRMCARFPIARSTVTATRSQVYAVSGGM